MRMALVVLAVLPSLAAGCELFYDDDGAAAEPAKISLEIVFHWDGGISPAFDMATADEARVSIWTEVNGQMGEEVFSSYSVRQADDSPTVLVAPGLSAGGRYRVLAGMRPASEKLPGLAATDFNLTVGNDEVQELHISPRGPAATIVAADEIIVMTEGGDGHFRAWALNDDGHHLLVPNDQWRAWSDDPQICPAWDGNFVATIGAPNVVTHVYFGVGEANVKLGCGSKHNRFLPVSGPITGRWESGSWPLREAYEIADVAIKHFLWEEDGGDQGWVLNKTWSPENGDVIAISQYGLAFACRDGRVEHRFRCAGKGTSISLAVDDQSGYFSHPEE